MNDISTIFRWYVSAVLFQFAVIGLFTTGPMCDDFDVFFKAPFWWSVFAAFGALTLMLRKQLKAWKLGILIGDMAAVTTFSFLSYDYLTRKPPIYAAGVLAATTVIFLIGGLINERRSTQDTAR